MKIALLALLLCQDDVTKGWKHPWSDAKVGDRVKWKITTSFGTPEKTGLVSKVEKDFVTVGWQQDDTKSNQVFHTGPGSELVGKWARTGDEEVKVGDKAFKCAVYELKKESGSTVQTTRVWKSPDAPHWAVKSTWSQSMKGKDQGGWVEELTAIDEVVKIGGKDYKCRVLRKTTEMSGIKGIETLWWNDEIPGRIARKTTQSFMNGKEVKEMGSTEEVVEFEKK